MGCCSCKYLNENDKNDGSVCGATYYCSKIKSYVNGNGNCDNYEYNYSKSSYIKDEIYNDGKNYYDDNTPIEIYLVVLVVLIILVLVQGVFQ